MFIPAAARVPVDLMSLLMEVLDLLQSSCFRHAHLYFSEIVDISLSLVLLDDLVGNLLLALGLLWQHLALTFVEIDLFSLAVINKGRSVQCLLAR